MQQPQFHQPGRTRHVLPALLLTGAAALVLATAAPGRGATPPARPAPDAVERFLENIDDVQWHIDDLMAAVSEANDVSLTTMVEEFDESEIFLEENATDGDLGIQFELDGQGWDRVVILSPDWRRFVDIKVKGNAAVIGLTQVFSESAEPSFKQLPREEFLELFPPGTFLMLGKTIEGDWLVGDAELTHDLPKQPVVVAPKKGDVVDPGEPLTIEWETVPDPNPPDSVIEAYQVIVEKDVEDERLRVLSADMLPTDTTFTVAPGFLEPGREYKFEIIAIETSNNKTITEVSFETEE